MHLLLIFRCKFANTFDLIKNKPDSNSSHVPYFDLQVYFNSVKLIIFIYYLIGDIKSNKSVKCFFFGFYWKKNIPNTWICIKNYYKTISISALFKYEHERYSAKQIVLPLSQSDQSGH